MPHTLEGYRLEVEVAFGLLSWDQLSYRCSRVSFPPFLVFDEVSYQVVGLPRLPSVLSFPVLD